jgi:hypothetical protein
LSKLKLRDYCYLLLLPVPTAGLSAEIPPTASNFPSGQQVIAFLTESIDWYRHRAIEERLATEPADLLFLQDNRPIAAQVVQLSFDSARADASLAATFRAGNQKASAAIAGRFSPDLAHFVQLENNADLARRHGVSIHHINVDAASPRLLHFGPLVHPNAKSAARIGGTAL